MCFEIQTLFYCHVAGHVAVGFEKVGEMKEGCNCGIVTASYTDLCRDPIYAPACTECMEIQRSLDTPEELPDATAHEADDFALSPPAEDLDPDLEGFEHLALTPTAVTFPDSAEVNAIRLEQSNEEDFQQPMMQTPPEQCCCGFQALDGTREDLRNFQSPAYQANTPHSLTAGANPYEPEQLEVFVQFHQSPTLFNHVNIHVSYNDDPPFN